MGGQRAGSGRAWNYLLSANSLAWTVYISGPLLPAGIAAIGIWLTRSSSAGGAGTSA